MLTFEIWLDYFIDLTKLVFIIAIIAHFTLPFVISYSLQEKLDPYIFYLKEITDFMFIISMAVLLIYHFKPGKSTPSSPESSFIFFIFGWFLLFSAKWNLFITEAPWYSYIVN